MTLTSVTEVRQGSDFAILCRRMRATGLLERRRGNYAARILGTIALFVLGWTAFVLVGDSWWTLAPAAVLGVLSTQISFLGHDSGHQQIARTRRVNAALGLLTGDLLAGLSYGWWNDKHNRHHANPNREGFDPDIGDGALAFTTGQVAARTGAVSRFVAAHQAWLFFPLLTLEGLNLHVQGMTWVLRGAPRRHRRIEIGLLGLHLAVYFAGVFLVLSPLNALAFIALHQAIWGVYMGCSFAPNHKGMPTLGPDEEVDFLRRQVLTSRNVRGGRFTDLALGGLNYQIEHHLFPNMPRANLRYAQAIVQQHCRDLQISYLETSLIGSYVQALRHLNTLGAPLRAPAGETPNPAIGT
jgi:fatty acid desaturase